MMGLSNRFCRNKPCSPECAPAGCKVVSAVDRGRRMLGVAGSELSGRTPLPPTCYYHCGIGEGEEHPMNIQNSGIDPGKTVCSLAGLDQAGEVVFCKRLQRH